MLLDSCRWSIICSAVAATFSCCVFVLIRYIHLEFIYLTSFYFSPYRQQPDKSLIFNSPISSLLYFADLLENKKSIDRRKEKFIDVMSSGLIRLEKFYSFYFFSILYRPMGVNDINFFCWADDGFFQFRKKKPIRVSVMLDVILSRCSCCSAAPSRRWLPIKYIVHRPCWPSCQHSARPSSIVDVRPIVIMPPNMNN
jgi:hypothetical protein